MGVFREILLQTDDLDWVDKTLAGLSQKMLWRDDETGASIAIVKFEQGSGVPSPVRGSGTPAPKSRRRRRSYVCGGRRDAADAAPATPFYSRSASRFGPPSLFL